MKYLLLIVGLILSASTSYAVSATIAEGDNVTFSTASVTTAAYQLAAYSSSRTYLECRNVGAAELYIGGSSAVTAGGATSFIVGVGTSTGNSNMYITRGHEAVFGITAFGTTAVNCVERR